jgi:hypothetical protein
MLLTGLPKPSGTTSLSLTPHSQPDLNRGDQEWQLRQRAPVKPYPVQADRVRLLRFWPNCMDSTRAWRPHD